MQRFKLRVTHVVGLVACAALMALAPSALADTPTFTPENAGNLWFVELASPPTADGTSLAKTRAEKAAFRAEAKDKGVKFTERFAFDKLWNGVSVSTSREGASSLARLESVKAIYPVETYRIPETASISPELSTALAMTGADAAQSEHGLTGDGIRVAVMDTGVDYHHPDLGGCFGPGCRVAVGHDFVGDAFNAFPPSKTYNPVTVPDADPDDCNGHGTHVAGIIGADGEAVGVAPEVTFGAYRVFGCEGSTTADIMIAAMERALADDMDILNMSIGSAFNTWSQYPTAAASNRMVAEGMIVVASIGNSGASGVYSAGAPGVGKDVIGVASFDNSHINALTFRTSGGRQVPYLPLSTTPDPPTSGTTPEVVWVGRGCTSLGDTPANDPSGKIALMIRGTCTFQEKYQGAANAGAAGVVIYNNATGLFAGGGVTSRDIVGIAISDADGLAIRSELESGPVTLEWTNERVDSPNPTGGLISSFSSYGLGAELDVKPDIGAPGGLIRSTYPLEKGGYATVSGTSMSSPHVAGAVALLLEKHPSLKGKALEVRSILQNSADPKRWWAAAGFGPEVVHRQGAGMVQIDDAVVATTGITPGKLALGESAAGPQTRRLTLTNSGTSAVTYGTSRIDTLSTGGPTNSPGFFFGGTAVAFAPAIIVVPAGGTATVDVTIAAPAGPDRGQYGGYLVFTPEGGGQTLRVPFAGFIGDYQSIQVLTPTASTFGPFPKMGRHVDYFDAGTEWLSSYASVPAGGVYTMATTTDPESGRPVVDTPAVLAHLEHQARTLRIRLLDADGNLVGGARNSTVYSEDFLPRSGTATGFSAFHWDGNLRIQAGRRVVLAPQPDGQYKLRVEVLKALGDTANPAHWETWDSPMFVIDRP